MLTELPQNIGGRFYIFLLFCATWKLVVLFKVIDVHIRLYKVVSLSVLEIQNQKEFYAYRHEYVHILYF